MGHSDNPYAVLSWDVLLNGQTTHNGGAQRPSVHWKEGGPISGTRLATPTETVRAASLDDTSYQQWTESFAVFGSDTDVFLRLCVNNGVPLRVSVAIDSVVANLLERSIGQRLSATQNWASLCWTFQVLHKMLFGTGCNGHLNLKTSSIK